MKFKISLIVSATIILITSCDSSVYSDSKRKVNGVFVDKSSRSIEWNEARRMIEEYRDNPKREIKVRNGDNILRLEALSVRADHIDDIINRDDGIEIKELIIMFAVDPATVNEPNGDQYITTVLGGIATNDSLQVDILYEFCEPCPDRCPSDFNTSNIPPEEED